MESEIWSEKYYGSKGNYQDAEKVNDPYYVTDGAFANFPLPTERFPARLCEESHFPELEVRCNELRVSTTKDSGFLTDNFDDCGYCSQGPGRTIEDFEFVSRRPMHIFKSAKVVAEAMSMLHQSLLNIASTASFFGLFSEVAVGVHTGGATQKKTMKSVFKNDYNWSKLPIFKPFFGAIIHVCWSQSLKTALKFILINLIELFLCINLPVRLPTKLSVGFGI